MNLENRHGKVVRQLPPDTHFSTDQIGRAAHPTAGWEAFLGPHSGHSHPIYGPLPEEIHLTFHLVSLDRYRLPAVMTTLSPAHLPHLLRPHALS